MKVKYLKLDKAEGPLIIMDDVNLRNHDVTALLKLHILINILTTKNYIAF